jgi:hypothetical protein
MIRLSILLALLLLPGCASNNTRIVATGVGEYMAFAPEQNDAWWSRKNNDPELYKRASEFCGEEKAVEEIKEDSAANGVDVVPNESITLRFRCITPAL